MASAHRFSRRAIIWITGPRRKDTIISIAKVNNSYKVYFIDKEINSHHHTYIFRHYRQLLKYLELIFENVHTDEDDILPYSHFQWDIPGFTSSLIDIGNIDEANIQRTFFKLLDFFMNHRSSFL